MRTVISLVGLALTMSGAFATDVPPPSEPAGLREIADQISADELHATIAKLVGFGTRHTLSDTKSNTRGIGAARRWVQSRFDAISKDCGGCLESVTPAQTL